MTLLRDRTRQAGRLRGRAAVAVVGLAMTVVVLGSTIPSGLYTIYQRQWDLPVSTTTIVFSMYIAGVLVALLLLGHLSDHLGRKPVMAASVLLSIASSVTFVLAANADMLYVGRFLSGLSVGICTGAFTASLREHARTPLVGALLSTVITSGALAVGPMASGLAARHVSDPLHAPYLVYAIVAAVCLVALLAVSETRRRSSSTPWVQVKLGVPAGIIPVFAAAAVAIGCAYAGNGLFQGIVPLSASSTFGDSDLAAAGYTSLMLAASAIVQIPASRLHTRVCTRAGLLVLAGGFVLVAAAMTCQIQLLLVLAAIVCGAGNGMAFRGSLARVAAAAPTGTESRVVSSYYVVGYVATAVPALLVGALSASVGLAAILAALTVILALTAIANAFFRDLQTRDHDETLGH